MNKKIKLSLLGVLFASSALAITLPIVSCSGDTSTNNNLIVTKGDNAQLAAIGTAIAAVGRNGTNNNTTTLTEDENTNALKATYTGAVKTAIDDYFSFRNGANDVADADAIESIALTGTYPSGSNVKIFNKIVIKLKNPYTASEADLTIDVQIGVTYTNITIVIDRTKLNELGTAIASVVSSNTNNNGSITLEQFNQARTLSYSAIRTAVDNVFSFSVEGVDVPDATAIDSIRWLSGSGTEYPTATGADVNVVMEIMLKNPYQSDGNRVVSIKIGVRPAS